MQAPAGFPATQRQDTQEFLPPLQVSVGCGAALETRVQGLTFSAGDKGERHFCGNEHNY